jgi:hypothetical protein
LGSLVVVVVLVGFYEGVFCFIGFLLMILGVVLLFVGLVCCLWVWSEFYYAML